MRVLLIILILLFNLQSLTKADDIRDFEIEGISIGDSLLDHFNKEIIDYIVEYFEVSRLQASEYVSLIPKDSMKDLLREFGKSEKEIKKLVR